MMFFCVQRLWVWTSNIILSTCKKQRIQERQEYLDEGASLHVHGKIIKEPLTDSPFVRWLDYGVNYEDYWNYHHIIAQFEDTIDCLQVLYQHQYDFIFYFDHSSGHDRL